MNRAFFHYAICLALVCAFLPPAARAAERPSATTLDYPATADPDADGRRLSVRSIDAFLDEGGWIWLQPRTQDQELAFYAGRNSTYRDLILVTRPAPRYHKIGAIAESVTSEDLRALQGADPEVTYLATDLHEDEASMSTSGVVMETALFEAGGGWAMVANEGRNTEIFHYGGIDASRSTLTRLTRPQPQSWPAGTVVFPIKLPSSAPDMDASNDAQASEPIGMETPEAVEKPVEEIPPEGAEAVDKYPASMGTGEMATTTPVTVEPPDELLARPTDVPPLSPVFIQSTQASPVDCIRPVNPECLIDEFPTLDPGEVEPPVTPPDDKGELVVRFEEPLLNVQAGTLATQKFYLEPSVASTGCNRTWTAVVTRADRAIRQVNGTLTCDGRGSLTYRGFTAHERIEILIDGKLTTGYGVRAHSAATVPPQRPEGLTATSRPSTTVELTWGLVDGATGYQIQRLNNGVWQQVWTVKEDATTAYLSLQTQGVLYHYRVLATNAAGSSPPSQEAAGMVELPPATPSGFTAEMEGTGIRLRWNPTLSLGEEDGPARYWIERSGPAGSSAIAPTKYQTTTLDTYLPHQGEYQYRIQARNGYGYGAFSSWQVVNFTPPGTPQDFTAAPVSHSRIDLTWSEVPRATYYIVERWGASGWTQIHNGAAGYSDTGLSPLSTYSYRVWAYNGAGTTAHATASGTTRMAPPTITTTVAETPTQALLRWTEVNGSTMYFIERRQPPNAWELIGSDIWPEYRDRSAPAGAYVQYRVRGSNASHYSGWSNVADVTMPPAGPPPPTGVVASSVSTSQINLAWNSVSGASQYIVLRYDIYTGEWVPISSVNAPATTFPDTGLQPNTTYYYAVRSVVNGSQSADSTYVSATTGQGAVAPPTISTSCASWKSHGVASWHGFSTGRGASGYIVELDHLGDVWTDGAHWSKWIDDPMGAFDYSASTSIPDGFGPQGARGPLGETLAPGQWYKLRVIYQETGEITAEATFQAKDCGSPTLPAAPPNVLVTPESAYQLRVTWDAVSEATSYDVERSRDQIFWERLTVDEPLFLDSALVPGSTYFYRVRSTGPGGVSSWSPIHNGRTAPPSTPAAPKLWQFCMGGHAKVMISWERGPNAQSAVQIQTPEGTGAWNDGVHWSRVSGLHETSLVGPGGFQPVGQSEALSLVKNRMYEVRVYFALEEMWSTNASFIAIDCQNPPPGNVVPIPQGSYVLQSTFTGDIPASRGWKIQWRVPRLENPGEAWTAVGQWYYDLESGIYHTPEGGWSVYYYGDENGAAGNHPDCTAYWPPAGQGEPLGAICGNGMDHLAPGSLVKFKYVRCNFQNKGDVSATFVCVHVDLGNGWEFLARDSMVADPNGTPVKAEMYAHDVEIFDQSVFIAPEISCTDTPTRMAAQEVKRRDGSWKVLSGNKWRFDDHGTYKFQNTNLYSTPASWESCSDSV